MFVTEYMLLVGAVYAGVFLRFGAVSIAPDFGALDILPAKAALFAIVMILAMVAMGLYQAKPLRGKDLFVGIFLRVFISVLLGMLGLALCYYVFPELYLGRGVAAFSVVLALFISCVVRVIFYRTVSQAFLRRRILVLGSGERASSLLGAGAGISNFDSFFIHGFVEVEGEQSAVAANNIVRPDTPLLQYCKRFGINEIVIAVNDRRGRVPVDELLDCKMANINVIDFVSLQERENGMLCLDMLQPSWILFSEGCNGGEVRQFLSRTFDIVGSLSILLFMLPVMLLAAVCIYVESGFRGPIFYRQKRVGLNDQCFDLFKFRSMNVDAEKNGAVWAAVNDNRITRTGAIIRKFRIDELPQLLNILLGDMSIVGPRPERPEFVEQLQKSIPFYKLRHRVKPGLAGWAQMKYPYGASEDDAYKKLQYDLYYVKNNSVLMDLFVLLQTVEVVLLGEGVR